MTGHLYLQLIMRRILNDVCVHMTGQQLQCPIKSGNGKKAFAKKSFKSARKMKHSIILDIRFYSKKCVLIRLEGDI